MTIKFPPPPYLATLSEEAQRLNRWLLEIQSILNNAGEIDPSTVAGLTALVAQVTANTAAIATNTANIATNTANIATNTANIATNTANIAANAAAITALQARAQVLNGNGVPAAGLGNTNDWYADDLNKHIYVKTAPGTWTLIL